MEPQMAAGEPAKESPGRIDDYVDIYISPAEVFQRRSGKDWPHPLLVLAGAMVLLYFVTLPAQSLLIEAEMPDVPAEAAQTIEQWSLLFKLLGGFFVPITIAVAVVFGAALLHLFGRLAGARLEFRESMLIAAFAGFVMLPQQLLQALLVWITQPLSAADAARARSFGLLRFLEPTALPQPVVALLGQVDLFALWEAALWTVGLVVIGRLARGRAVAVAAGVWVVSALPAAAVAAFAPEIP
ncbi:MAG: YIP1 family protein [Longimicrobiales bacterium]